MCQRNEPDYPTVRIELVHRSSPDELFLLTIVAQPEQASKEYGAAGGAFVNCWVDADDLETAQRRAVRLIQEHGWRPDRFNEWELVTRVTYADRQPPDDGSPDLREIVEQAFVDGEVCIFYTWPVDSPDVGDG